MPHARPGVIVLGDERGRLLQVCIAKKQCAKYWGKPSERVADAIQASISQRCRIWAAHGHSQPGRITILESLAPVDSAAVLVREFAHLCSPVGYVRWSWREPVP